MAKSYEDRRAQTASILSASRKAGRDIGPLPKVKNPKRKKKCRTDFRTFCETYFPDIFHLKWSPDHLRIIEKMQATVLGGGCFAMALPRGTGKSMLCDAAVIWAAIYGHRKFPMLIGASEDKASDRIKAIKAHLEFNDLLAEDFPEVCYPIRKLEGTPLRAKAQESKGERTLIEWKDKQIQLPTIKKSCASGAIIRVAGITGSVRGINVVANGKSQRPDLLIIDDPQTDESAKSVKQTQERLATINGALLGLAGPTTKIAVCMPITVIQRGDLADQILDRQKHPIWQGELFSVGYLMADLSKVNPGDDLVIPADTYNAFIDAAIEAKQRKAEKTPIAESKQTSGIVGIKSAIARTQFDVVQLTTPIVLPTANLKEFSTSVVLNGVTPTGAAAGRFAVLLEPLAANGFGKAVANGITIANVNIIDQKHHFCDIKTGQTKLQSSIIGSAQILWVAGGVGTATATGVQLAIVRIGNDSADWFFGKIVNAGPEAEADYTDNKHWFKRVIQSGLGSYTDLTEEDPLYIHSTLENLTGTAFTHHLLRAGDIVIVHRGESGYVAHQAPVLEEGTLTEDWTCPTNEVSATDELGQPIDIWLLEDISHKVYNANLKSGDKISFIRYSSDVGVAVNPDLFGISFGSYETQPIKLNTDPVHMIAYKVNFPTETDNAREDFNLSVDQPVDGQCFGRVGIVEWNGIQVTEQSTGTPAALEGIRELKFERGNYNAVYTVPLYYKITAGTPDTTATIDLRVPVEAQCVLTGNGTATTVCNEDGTFTTTFNFPTKTIWAVSSPDEWIGEVDPVTGDPVPNNGAPPDTLSGGCSEGV